MGQGSVVCAGNEERKEVERTGESGLALLVLAKEQDEAVAPASWLFSAIAAALCT